MGEVLAHYFIVKGYFYGKKLWGKLIDVDLLKASAILAYINIILYIAYTYYYIKNDGLIMLILMVLGFLCIFITYLSFAMSIVSNILNINKGKISIADLYLKPKKYKLLFILFQILTLLVLAIAFLPLMMLGSAAFICTRFGVRFLYISLMSTSVYSILFVLFLYNKKKITLFETVVHIILQLIFVLDIVDSLYLASKYKNITIEDLQNPLIALQTIFTAQYLLTAECTKKIF